VQVLHRRHFSPRFLILRHPKKTQLPKPAHLDAPYT